MSPAVAEVVPAIGAMYEGRLWAFTPLTPKNIAGTIIKQQKRFI
jgi:hypothetical protein